MYTIYIGGVSYLVPVYVNRGSRGRFLQPGERKSSQEKTNTTNGGNWTPQTSSYDITDHNNSCPSPDWPIVIPDTSSSLCIYVHTFEGTLCIMYYCMWASVRQKSKWQYSSKWEADTTLSQGSPTPDLVLNTMQFSGTNQDLWIGWVGGDQASLIPVSRPSGCV